MSLRPEEPVYRVLSLDEARELGLLKDEPSSSDTEAGTEVKPTAPYSYGDNRFDANWKVPDDDQ